MPLYFGKPGLRRWSAPEIRKTRGCIIEVEGTIVEEKSKVRKLPLVVLTEESEEELEESDDESEEVALEDSGKEPLSPPVRSRSRALRTPPTVEHQGGLVMPTKQLLSHDGSSTTSSSGPKAFRVRTARQKSTGSHPLFPRIQNRNGTRGPPIEVLSRRTSSKAPPLPPIMESQHSWLEQTPRESVSATVNFPAPSPIIVQSIIERVLMPTPRREVTGQTSTLSARYRPSAPLSSATQQENYVIAMLEREIRSQVERAAVAKVQTTAKSRLAQLEKELDAARQAVSDARTELQEVRAAKITTARKWDEFLAAEGEKEAWVVVQVERSGKVVDMYKDRYGLFG